MQSIVATITENCNYDGVQMLVEQTDVLSDSLRCARAGSWTVPETTCSLRL